MSSLILPVFTSISAVGLSAVNIDLRRRGHPKETLTDTATLGGPGDAATLVINDSDETGTVSLDIDIRRAKEQRNRILAATALSGASLGLGITTLFHYASGQVRRNRNRKGNSTPISRRELLMETFKVVVCVLLVLTLTVLAALNLATENGDENAPEYATNDLYYVFPIAILLMVVLGWGIYFAALKSKK